MSQSKLGGRVTFRFGLVLVFSSALSIAAPSHPAKVVTVSTRDSNGPTSGQTLRGDVVRLRTGAIVRGVIDEKFPGEYVTIATPSGTSRRFEWKDVAYAGPAPTEVNSTPRDVNPDTQTAASKVRKATTSTATATNRGHQKAHPDDDPIAVRKGRTGDPSRTALELASEALGESATEFDDEDTLISEPNRLAKGSRERRLPATEGSATRGRASPLPVDVASGPSPANGTSRAASTTGLVMGSIGVATLGVAVVCGLEWSNREGQLAALCGKDGRCSDGRPRELTIEEESQTITLNRDRKTYRLLALGAGGVGAAALVTATVLLLTSRVDNDPARNARLLVPLAAGADRGGVSIRLSF